MRIDRSTPEHAHMAITLSRRNLIALLAKLDGHPPDSAATLVWGDPNGGSITVRAEENDPHYGSRGYGPGPMVSDTEDQIDIVGPSSGRRASSAEATPMSGSANTASAIPTTVGPTTAAGFTAATGAARRRHRD